MNRSLVNSTTTVVAGEFISPYMVTVQVGYKAYPSSIRFFGSKGLFVLIDDSQRIISQYVISDNIGYIIQDFTSATHISFTANTEQHATCNTIRAEYNAISILKWQCHNNIVNGRNQTEYLKITDIPSIIYIAYNKKYLQLILSNHVIDNHLRLSAKHVEIIEAQGALSRHSKIDLLATVASFSITMRGDIIVKDSTTYLQLKGIIPIDLPTTVYAKHSRNKVVSFYDLELGDLEQILATLVTLNTCMFNGFDIRFVSEHLEYYWQNELPQNNALKISGSLKGNFALLQIEGSSDTLEVLDTSNQAEHIEIVHHDGRAILAPGLVLIKVFKGNSTSAANNYSLVENIAKIDNLKMFNNKHYEYGGILAFRDSANHLFYHCFPMSYKIKVNNIDYLVNGGRICAMCGEQDVLHGDQLIRYSIIKSNLANISKMIGVCFSKSLSSSNIAIQNNSLIINGLMLKDIEDNTKLYFGDTEILEAKVLKHSVALSSHTLINHQ